MREESSDLPTGDREELALIRNVANRREQLGWSQNELARRASQYLTASLHQTTVSRIEKGERPVRVAEAQALAEALGVSLSDLLVEPRQVAAVQLVTDGERELYRARGALEKEVSRYEDLRWALALRLAQVEQAAGDISTKQLAQAKAAASLGVTRSAVMLAQAVTADKADLHETVIAELTADPGTEDDATIFKDAQAAWARTALIPHAGESDG